MVPQGKGGVAENGYKEGRGGEGRTEGVYTQAWGEKSKEGRGKVWGIRRMGRQMLWGGGKGRQVRGIKVQHKAHKGTTTRSHWGKM